MKRICILSFSNIYNDRRVQRQIEAAHTHFDITVIGYKRFSPPENVRYIELIKTKRSFPFQLKYFFFLVLGRFFASFYEKAFWLKPEYNQAADYIQKHRFDLIHANDWDGLPVAVRGIKKDGSKVLFDAHEFSPEQEADNWIWCILIKPFREYLLHKNLPKIDEMITVSGKIGELYKNYFHIQPKIILNAHNYQPSKLNRLDAEEIHIIHHGRAIPMRHLEDLIDLIALCDDRFKLNFMLIPGSNKKYLNKMMRLSQQKAPGKVLFLDPVQPSAIISKINQFDVGIPFLRSPNLNIYYALPNKFFDFILAGLGIVTSPLPAMAEIIREYNIGRVAASQSPKDMAATLNTLTVEEINQFKRNSLQLAKEFNAETEMGKLQRIYKDTLG